MGKLQKRWLERPAGNLLYYRYTPTIMHLPRTESKTVEFKTAFNQDTIVSLVAFANLDLGSWFRVVLRKTGDGNFVKPRGTPQKSALKTPQKSSQKILDMLTDSPALTTQELAEQLGISRRAVAKHVSGLQSSGRLRRVGPDKGGHWEVVEGGE